ncbi:MAG: O-antigen ligase family protein, partial [Rubripirellula sp.]
RILIGSLADLRALVPWACAACIVLSVWSVFESTTKINPINVLAQRTGSFNSESGNRMNLRRAEGPLGHPIYFGMTLAMLFPWAAEGARLARKRRLSPIFLLTPVLCVLGVFGTMSRGPMLALAASAVAALFFYLPLLRLPLIGSTLLGGLLMFAIWPTVVEQLESFSGEKAEYVVSIQGKEHAYTGTKHRELLYYVYADAMEQAAWLGHGKWGSKITHEMMLEPHLRAQFRSIDNHYILLQLSWGLVGLGAFLMLGAMVVGGGSWLAISIDPEDRLLIGGITGSIAAIMLLLLTVWLASDFGFVWLMLVGMLSSAITAWLNRRSTQPAVSSVPLPAAVPLTVSFGPS